MRLTQLLDLPKGLLPPEHDPAVATITADSRQVQPGTVFFALTGTARNGADFIPQAIKAGASAIVTDNPDALCSIPLIHAPDAKTRLARAAVKLAGPQPDHIAAITGTNGKSSTADFLRQLWQLQGLPSASLGTLGLVSSVPVPPPPSLTTPDPISLANTLASLKQHGVNHVAIEASSHGLDQKRLHGLPITAAGFSNLTRDHLDYHGTIEAYRTAKLALFQDILPQTGIAAINADMDAQTLSALQDLSETRNIPLRTVGKNGQTLKLLDAHPTPTGQILKLSLYGTLLPELELAIPGLFQADNAMLAGAMCWQSDAEAHTVLNLLPKLTGVRGRCERAVTLAHGAAAYVDYAHTPDALERVLSSLRPHTTGRLVVVFGAGGDRDKGKRPLMGEIASRLADLAIVTDDNPRTENPDTIRTEIHAACPNALNIADRRAAISAGLNALQAGDILVVAGKGHEQGQIVGNTILPFDDRAVIRDLTGAA